MKRTGDPDFENSSCHETDVGRRSTILVSFWFMPPVLTGKF